MFCLLSLQEIGSLGYFILEKGRKIKQEKKIQTREDNIDIDKKKRNRLLSFSYWLRRFQSHYRGLAKRLICFSRSLVKSEFIGFEILPMVKQETKQTSSSPAPPFCRQHKGMGTGASETLKHGSTLPRLAPAWVLAPMGALVWQRFPRLPHPCGVTAGLGEWKSMSEGRDRPPALLCLTWGKSRAVSLVDVGSSQGKPGPVAAFGHPG